MSIEMIFVTIMFSLTLINNIGFLSALYLAIVERKKLKNPMYRPLCDISDRISCTKNMLTPYASIAGVPLSLWAMLYFFLFPTVITFKNIIYSLDYLVATIALLFSLYYLYIMFFRLRIYCIACLVIHAVIIMQWFLIMYLNRIIMTIPS